MVEIHQSPFSTDGFHSKSIVEQESLSYSELFDVYSVKGVDYGDFNGGNDDES